MLSATSKVRTILLSLLWLSVVCGGVALAISRREEYGGSALIAVGIAVFMLILFVISFIPKRLRDKSFPEFLGRLSVGALILLAIAVLGYGLVKGPRGILTTGIFVLFLVSFVRIFIDYLKYLGKPDGESRRKSKRNSQFEEKREDQAA